MTKAEFATLIETASRLCDDLLDGHPLDERLLASQAVLKEARTFVGRHWPDTFSEEMVAVDSSDDDLRKIQSRLMTALAIINSFTADMRRTQIESEK